MRSRGADNSITTTYLKKKKKLRIVFMCPECDDNQNVTHATKPSNANNQRPKSFLELLWRFVNACAPVIQPRPPLNTRYKLT